MQRNASPVARWCFSVHPDHSWTSRRVRVDGTVDPLPGRHADFGKAVAEALRIGFNPEKQTWAVEHRHWVTQYAPGASPVTVPRAEPIEEAEHAETTEPSYREPSLR